MKEQKEKEEKKEEEKKKEKKGELLEATGSQSPTRIERHLLG